MFLGFCDLTGVGEKIEKVKLYLILSRAHVCRRWSQLLLSNNDLE